MKPKKIIAFLILLIVFVIINESNCKAAEDSGQLEIDVKQDKSEYHQGDTIKYTITVKNSTSYLGNHLITNISLPKNITTSDVTMYEEASIDIGQEYIYIINGKIANNYNINTSKDKNSDTGFTGDKNIIGMLSILFVLSGGVLAYITIKKKKTKKIVSLLLVFIIGTTSFSCVNVKAANREDKNSQSELKHATVIDKKEYNLTVSCDVTFSLQGETELIINNELDENNQMLTDSESVVITGSARNKNGIKEIKYEIDDLNGNIKNGIIETAEDWSFEEIVDVGTSKITVIAIDNFDNETKKEFSVVRVNKNITVQENVKLLDENESSSFFDSIYEVFETGLGTEDMNDDGIIVILSRNSTIISELVKDKIIYISPGTVFAAGFTGKVDSIMEPSMIDLGENYLGLESGMSEYSDEEFIAVKFVTPAYDEVIAENICLKNEGTVDFDEDLVFALGPNGENLLEESSIVPYSAFKGAKPTISYKKGDLKIGFEEIILYDKDNNLETEYDQIKLDGYVNLSNIEYKGGIEVKKFDGNLLPKQVGVNLTYDLDENLTLYWESKFATDDLIENINKGRSGFKHKTEYMSVFNIKGVDMNKEIYLGSIAFRLFSGTGDAKLGVGYIGNYSDQSFAEPMALISFVLCANGELKLKFDGTIEQKSKESFSVTAVRKGFIESFVDKNSYVQRVLGNQLLANYNIKTGGYSKNNSLRNSFNVTGTAKGNLGVGINGAVMYLGIIPACVTTSAQFDANMEGKIGIVQENKDVSLFETEGKYSLEEGVYVEP